MVSITALAIDSVSSNEITRADLRALVETLRDEAGAAGDFSMVADCTAVVGVLTVTGVEPAPWSDRHAMKRVKAALIEGAADINVVDHVEANDVWEIWGNVDGDDFRVHIALR